MLTDSQAEASVDRWPSLDASGLLPCTHRTQFTGAGLRWEQIGLSANPLILIGADGVSRCRGRCCTVGRFTRRVSSCTAAGYMFESHKSGNEDMS